MKDFDLCVDKKSDNAGWS